VLRSLPEGLVGLSFKRPAGGLQVKKTNKGGGEVNTRGDLTLGPFSRPAFFKDIPKLAHGEGDIDLSDPKFGR